MVVLSVHLAKVKVVDLGDYLQKQEIRTLPLLPAWIVPVPISKATTGSMLDHAPFLAPSQRDGFYLQWPLLKHTSGVCLIGFV